MNNSLLVKTFVMSISLLAVHSAEKTELQADELFSRVSTSSVFGESNSVTGGTPDRETIERGRRMASVSQLADVLRDAGLEPKTENERIVSIAIQHGEWSFPVSLGINDAGDQIRIALTLHSFAAGNKPTSEQLLALLAANREHQPAFFSYGEKRSQMELFISLPNDDISPRRLREEIRRAATIADATASLWRPAAAGDNAKPAPTTVAKTGDTAPKPNPSSAQAAPVANAAPQNAANLVGKWSAARSATQAVAMQFNRDGTFALVSIIDGKQSKATGKFALSNSQLVLTTDAGASTASIANLTDSSFEFTPAGKASAKMTFRKAR